VQVAGWRETVQVKMDQFQEVKLPGGLHGEVFADGHARALRIRDSSKAPSSSAASSSAATGRSGGEGDDLDARYSLQVKLAGLGVSVIDAKLDEIMYLGAPPPRACSTRLRAIGILCACGWEVCADEGCGSVAVVMVMLVCWCGGVVVQGYWTSTCRTG
jgi:hypothetical protein